MTALLSPIAESWRGVAAFPVGLRWLLARPRYFFLLLAPSLLAVGLVAVFWGEIAQLSQWFVAHTYWEKPLQWYWLPLWWPGWAVLSAIPVALCVLAAYLVMKIVASPVFELVSTAIEREALGVDFPRLSLGQHVWVVIGELQKAAIILGVPILLLLIPGFNVISIPVAAFLIGWDFFDYPLARRGWTFRERWRFVMGELWSVTGFGLWFVIPLLNILFAPFAIAGGTLLCVEAIRRRKLA